MNDLFSRSSASIKREVVRNSLETLHFKEEIEKFLEDKPDYIIYSIKRDLACMTSMPYYKDRPKRVKIPCDKIVLLHEWIKLFLDYEDLNFIIKLLKNLNKNQSQLLRKIAPRKGSKKDIWEHAIPTSFIVNEIILMLQRKDITDVSRLISIYILAGQHSLTKDENSLLKDYTPQCHLIGTGEILLLIL